MIKLFEMFAGYGGASWGLKKANIPFECVGISEIDKAAIKCYETNFPNVKNFGDCTKINIEELPNFDLLTGGFPCQDVSMAGQRNLEKGRTNLYLEIIKIASIKKPKYILLENVKGLLSMEIDEVKLHHKIVRDLKLIGYGVCYKVLNSKDFGNPQNRERIWFVCKLGGWEFMEFQFPYPIPLEIQLKDLLEKDVPPKYNISEKLINGMIRRMKDKDIKINPKIANTICARYEAARGNETYINEKTRDIGKALMVAQELANKENKPMQLDLMHLQYGEIRPLSTYIPQDFDVHRCLQSGEPKEVLIMPQENISPSLTTELAHSSRFTFNPLTFYKMIGGFRKLTPKECFRLMGFFNDEINLEGLSDTQCYKLAGNGWDVNLVSKIFKRMFKEEIKDGDGQH